MFLCFAASGFAQGDAKRGEYLSKAGGCLGCHTVEAKEGSDKPVPYAGGRALSTPFGTFYGPNITPHPEAGIGRWSEADFMRAMREGRRPDGANYFPAFPYPSFTLISDADLRDLWAYLRSLPPSSRPSEPHDLGLLYRWRFSVAIWKWMFFTPGPLAPDAAKSAA
ncbi:MAG TPA: cytochrome c, partial [Hyphomicrobiaceae bacterium]